ncbi:MAG TPA: hypothetical protein VEA58_01905 [Anaerovoracaceae bacterium]|nr:hypothetical protein [Anaerovoracaceae bacterium]
MGFIEGCAGFSYLLGDFVATIALVCALWIAGAAVVNLGSEFSMDAPIKTYVAWLLSTALAVGGQISINLAGLHQTASGIFGQAPNYPIITTGCAIGLFIISRFLRKNKYSFQ